VKLSDLSGHGGEWLRGDGPEGDIVISSRVRLARNLDGHRFLTRAGAEERRDIAARVKASVMNSRFADRILHVDLEKETPLIGSLLVERHLISRELAQSEGPRGVAFGSREAISIMVNEEDHLRIQVLQSGLLLEEAWRGASAVDGLLDGDLPFAWHPRWGYLTACPTNAGTGMRASVMLHLPALALSAHKTRAFAAVQEMSLAVRGLFGEGTAPLGDLFQVSNQVTFGMDEASIVRHVASVVPRLLHYERRVREQMLRKRRRALEDRVWRAVGVLRTARLITTQETLEHLSSLRLGVNLGIVDGVSLRTVNDLFILCQPAHLQELEGRPISGEERDEARATFLRRRLSETGGGTTPSP
jgi:protein arginine kinase